MWAVARLALRILINIGCLDSGSQRVLWPILFLTRQHTLIKELSVLLTSIESIVAHILNIAGSRRSALPSASIVAAIVLRDRLNSFKFFGLVHVIIHVFLVVANRIALLKVVLREIIPLSVVLCPTSVQVVKFHAVCSLLL